MPLSVNPGDIVRTRKPHPCGQDLWRILYVGADVKLKCVKCARVVMLERGQFEKRVRKIVSSAEPAPKGLDEHE